MKLLQIKFSGFKSFANNTTINIKGNLVGIVGPNGCGKSNVMDAVRWVLGESSAKQLRGESMQDVIFNGSTSRNSVSRATVELVFDNSAKTLSGLWNSYSEISIKRLLSRQGESIYYINNQVVRRRDITDLFLGTGVGSKGYAVIEQGMISRIIESKPEELRLYLEEAAGVSKYREKRKETLNRLQDTRDNLLRLEDIQGELSKQIEYLAQQAQTAKHYQQLQAQLKQKQLLQVLIKMSKAETTLNEIKCNIANHESALAENSAKLELVDAELINRSAEKVQQELQLAKLTSQFNLLRTNLARLEERRRHGLELAERLAKDKYEFTEQLDDIHTHILELKQLTEEVTQEITANRLIIEEKQLIKEQKTVDFEAIEALYIKAGDMLTECGNEVNGVRRELDLLKNTLTHKKSQSSNLTTRLKRLEQEGAPNSLDFNQNYFELKDEMSELAMELEELTLELTDSKEQLATVIASKAEQHEQIQVNKANVSVINSQLATLNELLSQQSHQQDLTQVFDQIQLSAPLWHYIQVSPGYELAVEAVLAELLSALIIEDLNLLTAMPEQKLALWFSGSSSVTPKPGSLATHVVINNNKLLGLHAILNEYQIVETLEAALPQDGTKLVTRDGHILTVNYVVFNANAGQANVLEYQNKLLVLEGELAASSTLLIELEQAYALQQSEFNQLQQKVLRLEQTYAAKFKHQHALQLEFTKQEQIYLQTKRHQERVEQEIGLLNQELSYITDELAEIELKIETQELLIEELIAKEQTSSLNKVEHEVAFKLAKTALSEIDQQINQKIIDNQLLRQKVASFGRLIEDKEAQRLSINARLSQLASEEQHLVQNDNTQELAVLQNQIGEIVLAMEEHNLQLQQLTEAVSAVKASVANLQSAKSNCYDKLNQARLKEQEQVLVLQNQRENLTNFGNWEEEYDATELLAQNTLTLAELQGQINSIQSQIEALGLVNLKAIEDLTLTETKLGSLICQVTDLTQAIQSLETAIAQIDSETRRLLTDTYTRVAEYFDVYFKTLFGGGGARLELTETDILTSGLQIYAQPPGKKNSSIHLLSGGEKALTAMSLIFAFFNLNPAPFCLLDEVDAPLDDANTARFCKLVQELSASTQFVYISHNRLTMEMADQLIGVTMQEKGVSTTVSVSLVDAVQHAV